MNGSSILSHQLSCAFRRYRSHRRQRRSRTRLSRQLPVAIELLEDRRLLSATLPARLLKDINPGTGDSQPDESLYPLDDVARVELNGMLYFAATDGLNGRELWKTDGTESGTQLVKNIAPDVLDGKPSSLTVYNGEVFFGASDGVNGSQLWKSDGTDAGTVKIAQTTLIIDDNDFRPREFTEMNGVLYFSGAADSNGGSFTYRQLWKTNGEASGTESVLDPSEYGHGPRHLEVMDDTLFYRYDPVSGSTQDDGGELFRSQGTPDTTMQVKDLYSPGGSSPHNMLNMNGTLFFSAAAPNSGVELFKSDGTAEGTVLVKEIEDGRYGSHPDNLIAMNGSLYFTANDRAHGNELWKSDGTAEGTVLVKDIYPGEDGSFANLVRHKWTIFKDQLFFRARSWGDNWELWRSDGTAEGTVLVKEINPGSGGSDPSWFTVVGDQLYFRANDGVHGDELWRTDGTEEGTVLVQDLVPGSSGSSIAHLGAFGNNLVFTAMEPDTGRETYILDTTLTEPGMLAGELDRRFELQFTDDYITNWGGEDEKWIQGGDGTWFYLLPNGEFYDWEYGTGQPFGSPLNGTLIATLDSRYYEDPTLFHESQHYYLDRAYGLHKHLDTYYEDWSGEGEKWLVGEDKTWYYILPNGEFYEWDEGTGEAYGNPLSGTRLATLDPIFHARPTLLHGLAQPSYLDRLLGLERYNQDFLVNAGGLNEKWLVGSDDLYYYVTSDGKLYRAEAEGTASGALIAELDPIHHQTPFFLYNGFGNFLQKKYGLYSDGNIFENYGGEGEKWMQGDGEQWYIIHTDGRFVEWDGTPHQASGTTLALVAPSYHTEPSYLFEARAHSLDLHLELFRKFENYTVNACGANEKWIRDTGQRWYYILPNGEFYRWDGETCSDGNVNGTLWETFRPRHYDYPVLLHDTLAFHMDRRLGLYTDGTYGENRGGQGEKWILGEGGTEYFILPEGTLYQSLDGSVTNRTLVNFLIPDYHTKPALLHDAYEDNNTTTTSTTSTSTSTASTSSTGSATMTESSLADDPESDPGMRLEPEFDQIDTVFAEHGDLFI